MSAMTTAERADLREERHQADNKTLFGFWVYIMTDCVLFASLFATYAVLHNNTYGGPGGHQLFDLPTVLVETLLLLTSSFTCGLAMLAVHRRAKKEVFLWFVFTFLLGLGFLAIELHEFHHLAATGNSWRRSGFLSAFFTLVGTHGLHITVGLTWMLAMLVKVARGGLSRANVRRLTMLSLFWHFLDVVWIFIFTIVYLMGGANL
ncbi:MAG TPA: cytochrome o ubiquinol oxidase subunit III [Candidatus Saccharimonadales bacterium]|nr:cytochrome o ubiquinol oxidase subunit III [Candidatus Saccharimonadales bacterium]